MLSGKKLAPGLQNAMHANISAATVIIVLNIQLAGTMNIPTMHLSL
jgi:hypothetical protein